MDALVSEMDCCPMITTTAFSVLENATDDDEPARQATYGPLSGDNNRRLASRALTDLINHRRPSASSANRSTGVTFDFFDRLAGITARMLIELLSH
jgi:hypothetical protein